MENFPKILKNFIVQQMRDGYWTETDPPWEKVKWAWSVSENFLRSKARRGQNFLWITTRSVTPQPETELVLTTWTVVDVHCFSCALTDNEKHCEEARDRAVAIAKMISHLVSVNKKNSAFAPAWIARPADGGHELPPSNTVPPFFVYLLPIKFQYEED